MEKSNSSYDYSKLRGRVIERCKTLQKFGKKTGIRQNSLSNKMNGKSGWTQQEIVTICKVLKIPKSQVWDYFFTTKDE